MGLKYRNFYEEMKPFIKEKFKLRRIEIYKDYGLFFIMLFLILGFIYIFWKSMGWI